MPVLETGFFLRFNVREIFLMDGVGFSEIRSERDAGQFHFNLRPGLSPLTTFGSPKTVLCKKPSRQVVSVCASPSTPSDSCPDHVARLFLMLDEGHGVWVGFLLFENYVRK